MQSLQTLADQKSPHPRFLSPSASNIVTPLRLSAWTSELQDYPDSRFKDYILAGISQGFRIGFDPRHTRLVSTRQNMISAIEHPTVVGEYLESEKTQGRIGVVPPQSIDASQCHISPFGVIPKRAKPGKWRLILDLSSPTGHSVNDGIDKDHCSLSYVSVDHVVGCLLSLAPGALMAKVDIKEAYRNIPVHPQDRFLLGMKWQGEILVDKVLPFGLRSAPIIFSAVADALQWIIQKKQVDHLFHYLDDFITVAPPQSDECQQNLAKILETCQLLGVPIETDKTDGPTKCITFLGMELDSLHRTIRLPADKLARLKMLLNDWVGKKAVKKRDLLSLIGILHHASKVVRQGRSFLRRLIDLSTVVHHLEGYVRLNLSARSDIAWWHTFAQQWNGTSMLYAYQRSNPLFHVYSDASGSWGCGAYTGSQWFQFRWPANMPECHIAAKEMIPVVMAAIVWGSAWSGGSVRFHCDNSAVVALLNSGSVRDASLMHLIRCLSFVSAKFNFVFSADHIRGVENGLADALSRDKLTVFLHTYPQAQKTPSRLHPAIQDLLL